MSLWWEGEGDGEGEGEGAGEGAGAGEGEGEAEGEGEGEEESETTLLFYRQVFFTARHPAQILRMLSSAISSIHALHKGRQDSNPGKGSGFRACTSVFRIESERSICKTLNPKH